MRIPRYAEPAASLAEAKSRATILAAYLTKWTGAEWKPRFHENSGFWWGAGLGPISVHAGGRKRDLNTWSIYNAGPDWKKYQGTGHAQCRVLEVSSEDALLVGVKDSIRQLLQARAGWDLAIVQVAGTEQYKELINV